MCRKCAVRLEPTCANSRLFNTELDCFRAGLIVGKLTFNGAQTWKPPSDRLKVRFLPRSPLLFRIHAVISVSGATTGRPDSPFRTFQDPKRRKPSRCQATTVSGFTM